MAFCAQCGHAYDSNVNGKFCAGCGAPLLAETSGNNQMFNPITSGFSLRIKDPSVATYKNKLKKSAWIFYVIMAVLALIAVIIFAREFLISALITWVVVFFIIGIATLISNSKEEKAWEGTLVDKKITKKKVYDHQNNASPRIEYIPNLIFKTTQGQQKTITLQYQSPIYDYYRVGDVVRKHAGFMYPEKAYKDNGIICIHCGKFAELHEDVCKKCKMIIMK